MVDQRFVGYHDEPPEGMRFAGHAYGNHRYDIWTNGKSMFAPEFRWAMVPRDAKGVSGWRFEEDTTRRRRSA